MGSAPSQEVIIEKNDNNGHTMRVPRNDACEERETAVSDV